MVMEGGHTENAFSRQLKGTYLQNDAQGFKKINEAILNAGYTAVSLSDEDLSDLGGIIFLD